MAGIALCLVCLRIQADAASAFGFFIVACTHLGRDVCLTQHPHLGTCTGCARVLEGFCLHGRVLAVLVACMGWLCCSACCACTATAAGASAQAHAQLLTSLCAGMHPAGLSLDERQDSRLVVLHVALSHGAHSVTHVVVLNLKIGTAVGSGTAQQSCASHAACTATGMRGLSWIRHVDAGR